MSLSGSRRLRRGRLSAKAKARESVLEKHANVNTVFPGEGTTGPVGMAVAAGMATQEDLTWMESLQMYVGANMSSSRLLTALSTSVMTSSFEAMERVLRPDVNVDPAAGAPPRPSDGELLEPKACRVQGDPDVWVIPQALSDDEVEHLLAMAADRWEPSLVDVFNTGEGQRSLMDRSSYQTVLGPAETPMVKRIEERLAQLAGVEVEHLESFALVRYTPGQFFAVHHDGPDRPRTIFVYLNDLPEGDGGETYFPVLGLRFTPRRGCAVMWSNCEAPGVADDRMFHQGLPPRTAVKYGVNCFFNSERQR